MNSKLVISGWIISIVTIVYLSLTPRIEFPIGFKCADLFYHAAAYLWLSFLPFFGFDKIKKAALAACMMIPLGAGLEIGQGYIPGRFASMMDMVANTSGVVIGMMLGLFFLRKIQGKSKGQVPINLDE